MKINNKRELQNIAINHSPYEAKGINYELFKKYFYASVATALVKKII